MPRSDIFVCVNKNLKIYNVSSPFFAEEHLIHQDLSTKYIGAFSMQNPNRTLLITEETGKYSRILKFNQGGAIAYPDPATLPSFIESIDHTIIPNIKLCRQQYMYQGFIVCKGFIDSGSSPTGPTGPVGREGWFVIDIATNQIPYPNVIKVAATFTSEMRYGNYIFNYTRSSTSFDSEMTYIKYSDFIDGKYLQSPVVFNMKLDYHKGIDVYKGYIAGCGIKSDKFACYLTYVCTNQVHFNWSKDLPPGFGVANFRIELSIRLGVVLLYASNPQ